MAKKIIKRKKLSMEEVTPKIIRTCHDEDCPKCGFPETIIVRLAETMKPIWIECSKRSCDWGRKLIYK
jgi:hypothetical protein